MESNSSMIKEQNPYKDFHSCLVLILNAGLQKGNTCPWCLCQLLLQQGGNARWELGTFWREGWEGDGAPGAGPAERGVPTVLGTDVTWGLSAGLGMMHWAFKPGDAGLISWEWCRPAAAPHCPSVLAEVGASPALLAGSCTLLIVPLLIVAINSEQ